MPKLKEIAALLNGELLGNGEMEIAGVQSLPRAGPGEIAYVAKGNETAAAGSRAGALVVERGSGVKHANRILVADPQLAFALLLRHFHPRRPLWRGVSPAASVAASAVLGDGASVAPFAFIGEECRIGERTEIHPGATVYRDVVIGRDCLIYANAVIREGARIGDNVIIHPGAVIGADGFGFGRTADGAAVKVPQVGRVVIGDGCEIGANTCIDRSTIEETVLEANVKLDNLVQIGHNVRIGRDTAISAQTGVSGSTRIGAQVIMGGQVGIVDHIEIADGVMVAAHTGVSNSIKTRMVVAGLPHMELGEWRRNIVLARNLGAMRDRIRMLEKKIKEMEEAK